MEELAAAFPREANMGRMYTGWGVGMEALGSPIWAHAMLPPFRTCLNDEHHLKANTNKSELDQQTREWKVEMRASIWCRVAQIQRLKVSLRTEMSMTRQFNWWWKKVHT